MAVDGGQGNASNISVGAAAQVILAGRGMRTAVLLQNLHATQDLYVGPTSGVSTANGIKIAAGATMTLPFRGTIYGIATGAATDVRYWEVF